MADYKYWAIRIAAIIAGVLVMAFPDPVPVADEVAISLGLYWFTFGMPDYLVPSNFP